jgi:tetratricopeptide (TPR) repeat protein
MAIRMANRPYPGPRPFSLGDHDRFFGRAAEAANLADLWRSNRLTIAFGPVASGKTSLLNAGVLPLMTAARAIVLPVGRISYGWTFPAAALPEHNPYTLAILRSWSPGGQPVSRLAGLSVLDFVRQHAVRHTGAVLAAVDQMEELLTDSGRRSIQRRRFLAELAEAVREEPRLHLLLVVREEALGLVSDVLGGARQRVGPLSPASAFEAVTRPVVESGRSFVGDAAERLVTHLRTSRIEAGNGMDSGWRVAVADYVEPSLLQVACSRLWQELPADSVVINSADVRRSCVADTALAEHCGRVIAKVADVHEMPSSELRSWLLRTFVTEHGTRGLAYEGMVDTAGMPRAVARDLADMHLLSSQRRAGSRWYELLSDRLIEPLRHAADLRPPQAKPTEYLDAAERAFTLGELSLAERYAEASLRDSLAIDLRLKAEGHSLLGNLAWECERPTEAETHYQCAASLFQAVEDTEAVALQLAASGQALLAQGRPFDALHLLRAAIDRMPNDLLIRTEFGLALWQLGESRAAIAELTTALRIDGGNAEALRVRGEILAYLGEARDAMRDLDRVSLDDRPSTRAARGLALARLGDCDAAGQEIEDAVAQAPRNGPVLLYAAQATAIGGDEAAAEELARRAVDAMDPALPPEHRETALQLAGRKHGDLSER